MKTKWMAFALIMSLSVNVAVIVTVGYHYYRNACLTPSAPCPLNQNGRHLYQSLGLSDEQLQQIKPLSRSFHTQLSSWESGIESKRNVLIDLLGQDPIDRKRIEETRRQIAALQDKLQQGVVAHIIQTKEILDPAQKKQFFGVLRSGMPGTNAGQVISTPGGSK